MQRGYVHLLIFLLGLFALAALAWLVAWLTGFPVWAQVLAAITTGSVVVMLVVSVAAGLIDAVQRLAIGPIRMNDDRGARVALRFVNAELDREERAALSKFEMPGLARVTLLAAGAAGVVLVAAALTYPLPFAWQMATIGALFVTALLIQSRLLDHVAKRGHARGYLHLGRCGACAYSLRGTPSEDDGCRVCPECGAAWKLGADQPTLSAHGEDAGED